MKTGTPWSVKGIEPEVREAAKDAARRSGLTLGEWLNSTILEQAEAGGTKPPAMHPLVRDRFASIAEELAMMTGNRPQAPSERFVERSPAPTVNNDAVIERIENNERYLSEALNSVNERLKTLNAEIARQAESSSQRAADAGDYAALEAAVRNIIGHLETSERRTHEAIHSVQSHLESLSGKGADGETGRRFQQIESLIDGLAQRVEQRERSGTGLQAIESQVKDFGQQIHSLKSSSEQLFDRAKSTAVLSLKDDLAELEKHIATLATHVESSSARLDAFNSDFIRLQEELGDCRSEMAGLAQQVRQDSSKRTDPEDLKAVQALVAQLSEHVEQLPLGAFERRLQDVAKRITEVEIRGRALPQTAEILQKFEELEQRFSEEKPTADLDGIHAELQRQFRRVDERLDAADDRLHSIENIERSISQLFQAIEDNRTDVHELAEEAARRVVLELQQSSSSPGMPPPELESIEQALGSLRQQWSRSDQQTQETFDALHDTLEEIVNRLAEIESGQFASEKTSEPVHVPSPEAQDLHVDVKAEEFPGQEEPALAPASPTGWHYAVHEHLARAIGELDAKASARDEASSAAPPQENAFTDEEEAPQSAPALAEDTTSAEESDFIAAARRAAQSAAQSARLSFSRGHQPAPQVKGAAARTRSALSQLASSLLHRQAALKPRHPPGLNEDLAAAADSTTVTPNNGRRRLLIAALLLLAAVSAFAVRSGYKPMPASSLPAPGERQSSVSGILTGSLSKIADAPETAEKTLQLPAEIAPEPLRRAAVDGRAEAQFVIAGRYLEGVAGAANSAEAAKWYRKAAVQGLAPAQYRLATMFERGAGVEQSTTMAKYWYEKAASQGNIKAMHNLGVLLAQGDQPDHNGSARWFAAAANRGVKDSQYNLALLYEGGLGVEKDPAEALFWYLAAARQGDNDASNKAGDIGNALPKPIVAGIRERLEQWQPKETETKANAVSLASTRG
jgi:localization factor PodJL